MSKLQKDTMTGLLVVTTAFGLIYGQLIACMESARQFMGRANTIALGIYQN